MDKRQPKSTTTNVRALYCSTVLQVLLAATSNVTLFVMSVLQVTVELVSPCNSLLLRCSGSSLAFPGYQGVWLSSGPSAAEQPEIRELEADGVAGSDTEDGAGSSDESGSSGSSSGSVISRLLSKLHIGQKVPLLQVRFYVKIKRPWTPGKKGFCFDLPAACAGQAV